MSVGIEGYAGGASPAAVASLIIVSWNTKQRLLECLRSITEDQHTTAIEIIVVDNGSIDGSADAVQRTFPQVMLIRNSANLGFARATNMGLNRASGGYLFLINSDIIVRPDAITTLIGFMDASPGVGLAGPRVLNADGTLQHSCRRFPGIVASTSNAFGIDKLFPTSPCLSGEIMRFWGHDTERSVDAVSGCFCVVRRSALREVGNLDEDFFIFAEDIDWCMRFHAAGWDVRFCPAAEVVHFRGASWSNDRGRFAGEMLAATATLYRKHYSKPVAAYLLVLAVVYHLVRLVPRLVQYALRPARRRSARIKIDEHLGAVKWLLHALR